MRDCSRRDIYDDETGMIGEREKGSITVARPILLIIFNRPELTRQVVDELSKWPRTRIYIAGDGPRSTVSQDAGLCGEAQETALALAQYHEVRTLFQTSNLGCAHGVSSAISWFFRHEQAGLILEDDCVPLRSFDLFADLLLSRYEADERVMMISGNNFIWERSAAPDEYYFMRHAHIWGWATWRRAWEKFDFEMADWPTMRGSDWLTETCRGHKDATRYWQKIFDRTSQGFIDTWDYRWVWSMWRNEGLAVAPSRNLVRNIGFAKTATHTHSAPAWLERLITEDLRFPLKHQSVVHPDLEAERFTDVKIFDVSSSPLRRLVRYYGRGIR